jgi:hypothetical protein
MAYVHIATSTTQTIDHFNEANELLAKDGPIEGLIAEAAGSSDQGFHVVSIWESKAHLDRFEAERLFAVSNQLSIPMETLMATTSFTTFDTDFLTLPAAP